MFRYASVGALERWSVGALERWSVGGGKGVRLHIPNAQTPNALTPYGVTVSVADALELPTLAVMTAL